MCIMSCFWNGNIIICRSTFSTQASLVLTRSRCCCEAALYRQWTDIQRTVGQDRGDVCFPNLYGAPYSITKLVEWRNRPAIRLNHHSVSKENLRRKKPYQEVTVEAMTAFMKKKEEVLSRIPDKKSLVVQNKKGLPRWYNDQQTVREIVLESWWRAFVSPVQGWWNLSAETSSKGFEGETSDLNNMYRLSSPSVAKNFGANL